MEDEAGTKWLPAPLFLLTLYGTGVLDCFSAALAPACLPYLEVG